MNGYSKNFRPVALTVAGFDPSGGAGVLADIKTFEASKVYGVAANTCITIQNDVNFDSLKWMQPDNIIETLSLLSQRYNVRAAKLGMHKSIQDVLFHVDLLREFWPDVKIVWDPVLKSSSGYDLKMKIERAMLEKVLRRVTLITPNLPELERLRAAGGGNLPFECLYLVKGGHAGGSNSSDLLFSGGRLIRTFSGKRLPGAEKHGSGCVMSAAITAGLAKGQGMNTAIKNAKDYARKFLLSNKTLSGYHLK